MFITFLVVAFSLFQAQSDKNSTTVPQGDTSRPATSANRDSSTQSLLLKVKRIYVESFGEDSVSKQLQGMIIDALAKSQRFIVTENKERADAVLKGVGTEKTNQELHSISEGTIVGTAAGGEHGEISGSNGSIGGSQNGGFLARKMGTSDAQTTTETIEHVRIAVRLISADGDVIWSSVKESRGAKYKGAAADAAEQTMKQLSSDIEKLTSTQK